MRKGMKRNRRACGGRAKKAAFSALRRSPMAVSCGAKYDAEKISRLMLSMRGAPTAGRAQNALMLECVSPKPDKTAVVRAWARGARFNNERAGVWPGMFLSSIDVVRAQPQDKSWLWEAMATAGADLWQVSPEGLGFEGLAIKTGDASGLAWWKSKGGGLGRRTPSGRSLWSMAFEKNSRLIEQMINLWPEEASDERLSEELYGLRAALAEEAQARGEGSQPIGMYQMFSMALSIAGLGDALAIHPEWIRPNSMLSDFLKDINAPAATYAKVRELEQGAVARFERGELAALAIQKGARVERAGVIKGAL